MTNSLIPMHFVFLEPGKAQKEKLSITYWQISSVEMFFLSIMLSKFSHRLATLQKIYLELNLAMKYLKQTSLEAPKSFLTQFKWKIAFN